MVDEAEARPGLALRVTRWLVLVPLTLLCLWAMLGPSTGETMAFTVGVLVLTVGSFIRDASRKRAMAIGLAISVGVLVVRFWMGAEGETITNTNAPGDDAGRWLDRVVPERELALGGSRLLLVLGMMPGDEPGLLEHLADGYSRLREAEGAVPSPVLGNLVLGQEPDDHGVLRVTPDGASSDAALVFLHGYMGSTTLNCWQVAQGAAALGIETRCPAMDWRARWDTPAGRRIARETIEDLRAESVERVYLAGLSAGAIGASRIGRDLDVDGLILLSGASRRPRPVSVPTLILQGEQDPMTPPELARAYARQVRGARYVEFPDAGHWMVLSHHTRVTAEITGFLSSLEDP